MLTVVKNAPNLLSNLAPILPIFEKMEKNGLYFIFGEKPLKGSRLEICHDRRNQPSCKFFSSCVNFSSKQHIPLQNLCQNINFTHLFGKITHTFTHTFNKKRTKLIYIDIYAALLLAKIGAIFVFLLCKIFGQKIWSCKIFDKFQV